MEGTPESVPEISADQVEEARKLTGAWTPSPDAEPRECLACGEAAVVHSDDLEWEEVRGHILLALRRLSGERCKACGETWFDPQSVDLIQRHRKTGPAANYEAKVSRVGGTSLGIYFPKDLQRVMEIEAGDRAFLTPVGEDTVILEIGRESEGETSPGSLKAVDDALGF